MADIINAASGYQTGSIDTATTLVNNVSPTDAKHINYPAGAIIQIETILGSGTTLKGSAADTATRLGIALEASGKLKDFSSTTKTTFPTTVAEAGTGAVSFTDGAVLLGNGTGALQALALPSSLKILSHSGSAGTDQSWITGLPLQGPTSCGSGSAVSHSGSVTVSSNNNTDYYGIYYCTDFTLNVSTTITIPALKRRLIIFATNSITINGTITGSGAGGAGGASGPGAPGTDQAGGGGTQAGGAVLWHGITVQAGGSNAAGTQVTGRHVPGWADIMGVYGGAGGGCSDDTLVNGGAGGASIVLIAPTITLASTATLNSSGANGANGGGAGNIYIACRSYTDNGCTFTQTGGTGTYAGAAGVKQICVYG